MRGNPLNRGTHAWVVIPAKAGIQRAIAWSWTPAFARVTIGGCDLLSVESDIG
jgi:hypothetical protein